MPPIVAAEQAFTARTMAAAGDPGVVLVVVHRNGSLWCRGFGTNPGGTPITCNTPMAIGSLTKSVTALGIMQLVAKGQLQLDLPISAYLHSFQGQTGRRISVRDLLQQRSGFSTAQGLAMFAQNHLSITERLAALERDRPNVTASKTFVYSNANYDVLGALIERVSGKSYAAYVNARIFAPLGIAPVHTACEERVRGYMRLFSVPVAAPDFPEICSDVAAGGLVMSGFQYGRYLAAQLDEGRSWSGVVLDAAHWHVLHTPPDDSPYAMGWFVAIWKDGRIEWYHNGWAPAFHSFVTAFPQRNVAIARFANADEVPDGGRELAANLGIERIARGKVAGEPPPFPPDLYLRLGIVATIVISALQFRGSRRSRRGAALGATINVLIAGALSAYIAPKWAGDVRVGFLFSPDLTVLLLVLLALLTTRGLYLGALALFHRNV